MKPDTGKLRKKYMDNPSGLKRSEFPIKQKCYTESVRFSITWKLLFTKQNSF